MTFRATMRLCLRYVLWISSEQVVRFTITSIIVQSLRFENSAVRSLTDELEERKLRDWEAVPPQFLANGRLLLLGNAGRLYFLTSHDIDRRKIEKCSGLERCHIV